MPYCERRLDGSIKFLAETPQYEEHEWDDPPETWVPIATEWVEPDDPDVLAYLAAASPSIPTHLNNGGLARFSGAAPVSIYEAIKMAGVTRVSKGRYRVTHEVAMPTDQYSVGLAVMDANPRTIRYTARTANYVEVRVTDLAGAVQDPAEITIQTQRVITP